MSVRQIRQGLFVCGGALALSACGGGGGGPQVAAIPTAPATPTPTPAPAPPIPPPHLGLISAQPFAVVGIGDSYTTDSAGDREAPLSAPTVQDVQFSYNSSSNSYQISLPGFQSGTLANTAYNGSSGQPATSSFSWVTAGSSSDLQQVHVSLPVPGSSFSPYTYTSFGSWDGKTGVASDGRLNWQEGDFAYGIPTGAGDVPLTGTASYLADVHGSIGANYWIPVTGTASLSFDFAGGSLSGSMHAGIFDHFDGIEMDFGQYAFTQTVYSTGSTTFSGKFVIPNLPNADSAFAGMFTGPGAAELMARFQAPFLLNGQQGTMSGVWVGKKN